MSAPDTVIRYGYLPDQLIDVRHARGSERRRSTVAIVHGGFWRPGTDRSHAEAQSDALADAGFTVATVEYRRVPGKPKDTVADVRAALAALASTEEPILAIGHSAGGHLVLLAAADGVVKGVVALAPVASLSRAEELHLGSDAVEAFLGGQAGSQPKLDPILHAPTVPTTIVHGTADDVVPAELSELYVAQHPSVALIELQQTGHMELIDPTADAWPTVLAELIALD